MFSYFLRTTRIELITSYERQFNGRTATLQRDGLHSYKLRSYNAIGYVASSYDKARNCELRSYNSMSYVAAMRLGTQLRATKLQRDGLYSYDLRCNNAMGYVAASYEATSRLSRVATSIEIQCKSYEKLLQDQKHDMAQNEHKMIVRRLTKHVTRANARGVCQITYYCQIRTHVHTTYTCK